MHRGGEALLPVLPHEVLVRGPEEVGRRHRTEEGAERAGQQERARAGAGALAADVDEHDLEPVARRAEVGHDEVAGEALAVGREHARRAPSSPSGSAGIRPTEAIRSRRSANIRSPPKPRVPTIDRERAA